MKTIRVLVVDDSAFLRRNLPRILEMDPEIKVIGTAADGQEAVEMTKKLRPDVITLDVVMPGMDGLTALRHIMRQTPTPVIMVSSVTYEGERQTIEALSLGAIDFVTKPSGPISLDISKVRKELIQKVKMASGSSIKAATSLAVTSEKFKRIIADLSDRSRAAGREVPDFKKTRRSKELVAIGTSTGGPSALQAVLGNLPANLPAGIVIVQHIAKGFSRALAERLNSISALEIKVVSDHEQIRPGRGLLAPFGKHLTVNKDRGKMYAALGSQPADSLHIPSVDVLFSSVAKTCGPSACGVIMTGMGKDGAQGIKTIKDRGGTTIAQDEDSSVIFGMPKEAIEGGGIDIVAPLDKIAGEIVKAI